MLEFEKYKEKIKNDISGTELDFLENMKKIQKELEKNGRQK